MLSGGYFGVISPEGAASILGRYKDEKHKLEQFPKDCQALATAQCIYAHQLQTLGVVDQIIWEEEGGADAANAAAVSARETYKSFPKLRSRVEQFLRASLLQLLPLSEEELVAQRYGKYRKLGTFSLLDAEQRLQAVDAAKVASTASKKRPAAGADAPAAAPAAPVAAAYSLLIKHLAEEVVLGERSKYRKLAPPSLNTALTAAPIAALTAADTAAAAARTSTPAHPNSAKYILDTHGAQYMCSTWLPQQKRVLVTDTTMRDAHQVGPLIVGALYDDVDGIEYSMYVLELANHAHFSFL